MRFTPESSVATKEEGNRGADLIGNGRFENEIQKTKGTV